MRLLDVGCGWGSMAIHAAVHHRARSVGITISRAQAELARQRAEEAGVADRVEIRLQDYRDLAGESFDAISSVGMSEHVGHGKIDQYFATLRSVLGPRGRPAQSRHLVGRRLEARPQLVRRAVRVPRRRVDRRGQGRAGDGSGRFRGARRRVVARALRAHASSLGGEPRIELGRRCGDGGRGAGQGLALVHGWFSDRLRRRRHRHPSSARRQFPRLPTVRRGCRRHVATGAESLRTAIGWRCRSPGRPDHRRSCR